MPYRYLDLGDASADLETALFRQLHEKAKQLYAAKQAGNAATVSQLQSEFNATASNYLAAGGQSDQIEQLKEQASFAGQFQTITGSITKLALIGLGAYLLLPFLMRRRS